GRGRRLPRALQPDQEDDRRRLRAEIQPAGLAPAEQGFELVADDLDDLLSRRKALQDLLAQRLGADAVQERAHDAYVDVGFEQRHPDLAERLVEDLFADARLP